ncbi:hypothetical protein [Jiangella sp. DSM 45060]|uniref:hypothetical protein n=1 Tax=Jiangella sp. DSM 45060 TaxID=1798224 RepID=UPI000879FB5E|nr:hypothetical protein [Jiangella sp. DSM 45060]SDS65003.1 hypothetical protein SAMN04515669_1583 [Jiangella sp. DSM 45060]
MRALNETASYRESNRATAQLVLWTLAWAATLAAARFGPEVAWDDQTAASWAAVAVNVLVGIIWIVAFARFLRALDDLQRKIMQDALAVTLGVGWVAGFAYAAADAAGLVTRDLDLALFPAMLGVVYMTAFVAGQFRYR